MTFQKQLKIPYKCGNLPNFTATIGNDVCLTFLRYVCTTKPPLLIHKSPNRNVSVTNCDVIDINEISIYDQAYDCHGELTVKSSMVISR